MFRSSIGTTSYLYHLRPELHLTNLVQFQCCGELKITRLSSHEDTIILALRDINTRLTMTSPLSALSDILSSGIAEIELTYAEHGATFPSLDEPFKPEALEDDRKLMKTIDHVIAAASQLVALIKPVKRTILESSFSVRDHPCGTPIRLVLIGSQGFPPGEPWGSCRSEYT